MLSYKQYTLKEAQNTPKNGKTTITLWHGGNLDIIDDTMKFKKGRAEYGPGLYLTTHYDTAQKYSKGSRKFYQVVVEKGNNISDIQIPLDDVKEFVNRHTIKNKRKEVLNHILEVADKRGKTINNEMTVNAETVATLIINYDAIKPSNMEALRQFLLEHNVDYQIVTNPFGWGDQWMIVLYNMKKVVSKKQILPKDKIEVFDLPTKFS